MLETLTERAATFGVSLPPQTVLQFADLLAWLKEANKLVNLTSIREDEGIIERHFVESIRLGASLEHRNLLSPGTKLLDLGSGAGFPGLPLKLVWPDVEVLLLEATAKKARFIQSFIERSQLVGAQIINERAETLGHRHGYRETQDVVVSRAVALLPALIELALPLLRTGGVLAAIKGLHAASEQVEAKRALELCGGAIEAAEPLGGAQPTQVLFVRKNHPTPDRYPRRPGQPAAHPIH